MLYFYVAIIGGAVVALSAVGCTSQTPSSPLKVQSLRCEYHQNPLGIDIAQPRLSWTLESRDPNLRGQKQTAYQIRVASDELKLAAGKPDLWDSGKTRADQTAQIAYDGDTLSSGQQCFWSARIWDENGRLSQWAPTARWSMGILDPAELQAKWIGYDALPTADPNDLAQQIDLAKCKWIWTNEGDVKTKAPKGTRYFRKQFSLPQSKIARACMVITADDSCTLNVNGHNLGTHGDWHNTLSIDLTHHLHAGENLLAIAGTNGSDSPAGLIARLIVQTESGSSIIIETDSSWKMSIKDEPKWDQEQFDDSKWPAAVEIATAGDQPWGMPEPTRAVITPPPYLRKTFSISKPIARATVYASAQGLYELHLNGQRVGDLYFTPGWTDYHKRIYYNTYDVTDQLKPGANAIGAILGEGWYAGYVGFARRHHIYGEHPRFFTQLNIEYSDGTRQTIATDPSWKAAHGPILEADLLQGCSIDARKNIAEWDQPEFDDSKLNAVAVSDSPPKTLQSYPGSPVRQQEEIPATAAKRLTDDTYIFDLGQNMVGWVRIKIQAPEGTKLTVRQAEMLNPDGTLYTTALRSARATDTYICSGNGIEILEPKFTFHGFRYVEVSGLPSPPSLDTVTGIVVHADLPRTGTFECSNPLVNQLFHNIIWGQKGNYLEVPTDCPQRDERLGWMGDAQFFIPTGLYNMDSAAFFTKWIADVEDAQHDDGAYTDVSPATPCASGAGNTAWADAGIVCPYTLYKFYGDTRLIERHYASMQKYLAFLDKGTKDFIRGQGAYGDWLNLDGGAKSEVVGSAYYQYVNRLMAEMATAIGKKADAKRYQKIADQTKAAFIKAFVLEDGSIKDSSQTGFALAFTMDLLPTDMRQKAADRFISEIEKKNWHLATGFIGTPRLLPALSAAGRDDVAYRLLLTDTFPSWLYPVTLGATTMWERWDGWDPKKGFQNPGMNSFNHYAFGSVGQWMYSAAAGIDTDGPGFKKIMIHPRIAGPLSHVSATYDSINGPISSAWEKREHSLQLKVQIPPNTTATIYIPASAPSAVTESGRLAAESPGVTFLRTDGEAVVYQVTSGRYEFVVNQ